MSQGWRQRVLRARPVLPFGGGAAKRRRGSASVRTVAVWIGVLIGAGAVHAQSRVATTAGQFLTIGTGARGSAIGHAYTTLATGADALFWNPGGLARPYDARHRGSVFFTNTSWLADIEYNAFAVAIPVTASGVLGLHLAEMDYGRMDVRTVEQPEGIGQTFGAADFVLGLSYAQPLTDRFTIGGTVKGVRQAIWDMRARTVALDIGFVLVTDYLRGLRLGASIMNFGGKMQMGGVNNQVFVDFDPARNGNNDALPARLENGRWDLPLSFRFGVAVPVVRTPFAAFELLSDAHQTNDNGLNADLGAQLRLNVRMLNVDFRAGYKDLALEQNDSHLTLGAGLDLRVRTVRFGFDYAYVPYELLGRTQMLDLRLYY